MEYRRLGRTGIRVSELGLGGMTFGNEADGPDVARMVDEYLDAGGNIIDTADGYSGGRSEELIGACLGSRRDQVVLSTKVRFATGPDVNDRGASRRHILDSVHGSLRRLRTDRIDVYQLHCWDPDTPLDETLSTLDGLVRAGTVRYIGASNFAARHLAKALGISALRGWEPFAVLQPQYSLLSRGVERELAPLCREEGLGMLAWSPLAGGVLTGKYSRNGELPDSTRAADSARRGSPTMRNRMTPHHFGVMEAVAAIAGELGRPQSQVAINWVRERPGVSTVLLGARTADQLRDDLEAATWRLDQEIVDRLAQLNPLPPEYPLDFLTYTGVV